jgi:hypothetical protein
VNYQQSQVDLHAGEQRAALIADGKGELLPPLEPVIKEGSNQGKGDLKNRRSGPRSILSKFYAPPPGVAGVAGAAGVAAGVAGVAGCN